MILNIKVFGRLAEITGGATISLGPVPDTEAMKAALFRQYPPLAAMKFFIAVNNKMVQENTVLTEDAVVVLMPPFSGG